MDKQSAIYVLRGQIQTFRDFHAPPANAKPEDRASTEVIVGLRLLCEALVMTLEDTTKAHAPMAFDKAYKCLFDITQRKGTPSEYIWIAGLCAGVAGAMKWLFFSKPPARSR